MAGFVSGFFNCLAEKNFHRLKPLLKLQAVILNNVRNNHMFRHLSNNLEHGTDYSYEVSKDPKEWEFVEKLLPMETVPIPSIKASYPSGWRPPKEEALNHPYYVERSKNHMLSVYLKISDRGKRKITKVHRIHGDLWKLHDELKTHLEEQMNKKIASFVHEGNNAIHFKGDCVYYIEQWLLSKGF